MLEYRPNEHDDMILAIQSVMGLVDSNDDPWLHHNLHIAQEFLSGLQAEGYFD